MLGGSQRDSGGAVSLGGPAQAVPNCGVSPPLHASIQNVPLLVVASPDYLQAIDQDLSGAVAALSRSESLPYRFCRNETLGKLTDHLLPCDARLQSCLGGTRGTLNIRIADVLLQYMGRGPISLDRQKVNCGGF